MAAATMALSAAAAAVVSMTVRKPATKDCLTAARAAAALSPCRVAGSSRVTNPRLRSRIVARGGIRQVEAGQPLSQRRLEQAEGEGAEHRDREQARDPARRVVDA